MIISKECDNCLKEINKQHQINLDFQRKETIKKVINEFNKRFYSKNYVITSVDLVKEFRKFLEELEKK